LLLFAAYLFFRSVSSRLTLQNLQKQHHLLLDQKRILEGQVAQLQAEHRQKEALVNLAENELNHGAQKQLAANLQNVQKQEKQARQKAMAAELELALRKSATSREVEVLLDDRKLILRFYESTLFDPGELTLTASGKKLLASVAQSLNRDFTGFPIRIEGCSDNGSVPGGLKGRFPSNWELSAYRAAAVARSLQENYQVDSLRLTPVGKASTSPLESNETREGRAKNRRIDLVIDLQESTAQPEPDASPTP
jgi:chemotaxis protein MotB